MGGMVEGEKGWYGVWLGGWQGVGGGNRWYATLQGTLGDGGWDKWEWEEAVFPKVPAGMTRGWERLYALLYVFACVGMAPFGSKFLFWGASR